MASPKEIKAQLALLNPDAVLCDGLDGALVGVGHQQFNKYVAVYSLRQAVREVCRNSGPLPDVEAAQEYLHVNTLGAYVGEFTPIFLLDLD